MECKKALEEVGGDIQKARAILAKKGLEKASKQSDRATTQGVVATYTHSTGKIGAMVELLCETDFVARNTEFKALAYDLCLQVAAMNPKNSAELMTQDFIREPGQTVEKLVGQVSAKFGENIRVGKIARIEI